MRQRYELVTYSVRWQQTFGNVRSRIVRLALELVVMTGVVICGWAIDYLMGRDTGAVLDPIR